MLKSPIAIAIAFLWLNNTKAQTVYEDTVYNRGFENVTAGKNLPDKWKLFNAATGYTCGIDNTEKHGGERSVFMEETNGSDNNFASVAQVLPAKFIGKEITFKAYLKYKNVTNSVALLIRIDNALGKTVEFKSLQQDRINGTHDWGLYSITASIPIDAQKIYVASLLNGRGKLWVDDVQIIIDGQDISKAKINPDYNPNPTPYGKNKAASGTVKLKDATLYYESYGSGKPLLLLHGNSQSIYAFNFQIGVLARKFKVIAVDTRGQGKSIDETTGPLSYDLFADDMKQLLDSLHLKKVNILGWSDGGNTGLIMAEKYPAYVNKLATMGANLFPTNEALPDTVLNQVKQGITAYQQGHDAKSKMEVRLFTMLLNEPHLTFNDMKKIKAPVLVMAGEHDLILEKHTRAIAASIPKSQLVIFKGATHYAPVEIIKEFNETVMRFFEK